VLKLDDPSIGRGLRPSTHDAVASKSTLSSYIEPQEAFDAGVDVVSCLYPTGRVSGLQRERRWGT
jgi:hypothetical protein